MQLKRRYWITKQKEKKQKQHNKIEQIFSIVIYRLIFMKKFQNAYFKLFQM